MPVEEVRQSPWTRKHDDPRFNLIPQAPRIVYPTSLEQLIALCRDRPATEHFKAAGTHWALSQAAISDHTFIETHDPRNVHQAMGRTLTNVIPKCLNRDYLRHMKEHETEAELKTYLVHVEAGKRIYQLYAELDLPIDIGTTSTLAGVMHSQFNDPGYGGPWALSTLGGAGGQTVVGAFNTGTHGGDFDRPPVADSVLALHLVADGGRHYWIEAVSSDRPALTDDFMLNLEFGVSEYGGIGNFTIIRDNNTFNAVLVSTGRFGVIYSAVLRAVPQYSIYERRRLHLWQDLKDQIRDRNSALYKDVAVPPSAPFIPSTPVRGPQRFLQIAVCLTSHLNFQRNLAGVTKRWTLAPRNDPQGRKERVGDILEIWNERIQAPLFAKAGASHSYSQDPDDPNNGAPPSLIERACADPSFLKGVIGYVIDEIKQFVASNGAVVGAGIGAVAAAGGSGLLALIPAFLLILIILQEILEHFDDDTRFGEHMETIKNKLLDPVEPDPLKRAAGLFAWQMIYYAAFSTEQNDQDFEAISYAVMDRHDYLNVSCEVNVDSVEVFFDVADDRLIAFVDALIAYEMMQEFTGKAFVGYASLRFMGRTRALLGMQKFEPTCAVEVSCLRDVSGSQELLDYAVALARNPNINGVLHWGQRNDYTRSEVEHIFGDSALNPGGNLGFWRQALARVTDHGRLDGFSSQFTRRTGLEVVVPHIEAFSVQPAAARAGDIVTILWDCTHNPAGTQVRLDRTEPSGQTLPQMVLSSAGQIQFPLDQVGMHSVVLSAAYRFDDVERSDKRTAFIPVH